MTITRFDDYCIHQGLEPINRPAHTDRNYYDRYWFNGADQAGRFMFEAALGVYPNRQVMDCHFSVLMDGVQYCFHGSRRMPVDRSEMVVGPFRLQVEEPLRKLRLQLVENDTGMTCDLRFDARSEPIEEPQSVLWDDERLIMNAKRFTQFGCWEGEFTIDGQAVPVAAATTGGIRDRSWGLRPVGEREHGAPGKLNGAPQAYWVWAPLNFGEEFVLFNTFENQHGEASQLGAASVGRLPDDGAPGAAAAELIQPRHAIQWQSGTRHARGAQIQFTNDQGEQQIELTPQLTFFSRGLGYNNEVWGHGMWKGELVIEGERWQLSELNPADFGNIHVHQLVQARWGDRQGFGILETLCFGPHTPSGFKSILDGAP